MGNLFVNIKSTIVIMSNNVKSLLSWATTIGAATMALLGNTLIHDSLVGVGIYDSLEKSLSTLVIVSLVLIIAYIIILFFVTLYKVYSGRLTTTIFKDRKITILNGDVHQNFLYTINSNDFKKNYNEYIFIYPISMNGRADRTWPNSPSNKLIGFLDRTFNKLLSEEHKPSAQIQKSIDEFMKNGKGRTTKPGSNIVDKIDVKYKKEIPNFKESYPLEFGDMIESNVVLHDAYDRRFIINFLLVANYVDCDDMDYTFTHNDIIISNCINYVANLHQYKNLVMYLVGVHDYGMHLLNVFVSVINIFASIFTRYKQSGKGFVIKELTISCQKEDVDQWGVSFGQLEKYANTVSSYYKFK